MIEGGKSKYLNNRNYNLKKYFDTNEEHKKWF